MTAHDTGVTELLRQASDGLVPDVDRLVSGGISRGRSRRRRARIGTTVASLAVIGVVGGLAAVVPHLGGADSAREPGAATEVPSPTPTGASTPSPTPGPTEAPPDVPVTLAIPAADVPATAEQLLGLRGRLSQPTVHLDARDEKIVKFLVDGMVTQVGLTSDPNGTRARCEQDARGLGGTCEGVENGGWLVTWGPTLADGTTCTGVDLQRYGYDVYATSCNAGGFKDAAPLADLPPLDAEQLRTLVSSPVWFG